MKLADALIFIGADRANLNRDLDAARGQTESWAGALGGSVKSLLGGVVAGAAVAAGAAVVGIGVAAFDVSRQTDQAAANMAAALGLPRAEAERFAEVARRVYGNNFAGSVLEAADAVTEVTRLLKLGAEDPSLQIITEKALALKDSFNVDVSESISTVRTLMENFGISSTQAFDLLTAGYQRGLDRSGDFIDSINEYSVQFSNGGASAEEFFNLMETGLQGGMLGTDKAADAFKEFRVRILDGSKTTSEALKLIGLNAGEITSQIDSGSLTIAGAWNLVIGKLRETKDQSILMQAGVGLIGTQFEDLGQEAILNMALTKGAFDNVAGATDSLNAKYENFGDFASAIWRRLVVAISPVSDSLLDLANAAMPAIMDAFTQLEKVLVGQVVPAITGMINWFKNLSPETQRLILGITGLTAVLLPLIPLFGAIVTAIMAVTNPVGLVIIAIGALAVAWSQNWLGIQDATNSAVLLITGIMSGLTLAWEATKTTISSGWIAIKDAVTIAVTEFTWADFVTALTWPIITPFKWAEWIAKLIWPETAKSFTWETFVTVLTWPVIAPFKWAEWIAKLIWPEEAKSFAWDDWLDALKWPGEVGRFAWSDYVPDIDWNIPEFPGWSAFWDWVWGNEKGNANTSDNSTGSDSGGGSFLDNILGGGRAATRPSAGGGTTVYNYITVNAALAQPMDLYRLADELTDLIDRRTRRS